MWSTSCNAAQCCSVLAVHCPDCMIRWNYLVWEIPLPLCSSGRVNLKILSWKTCVHYILIWTMFLCSYVLSQGSRKEDGSQICFIRFHWTSSQGACGPQPQVSSSRRSAFKKKKTILDKLIIFFTVRTWKQKLLITNFLKCGIPL